MDSIRLYVGVLLFLCLFSFIDFSQVDKFITERKILETYKNSEKMLGFGVLQYENGVYIVDVLDMTPAKKAGIKEMDKIIAVEGKKIQDVNQFKKIIDDFQKNKSLNLVVYSPDEHQNKNVDIRPLVLIPQN